MDEHILPAIVGCDEAKTLVLIEKLNGTRRHGYPGETSGVDAAGKYYESADIAATIHPQ